MGSGHRAARGRVVLADDNVIIREGLRVMLTRSATSEIVGFAEGYNTLVACADGSPRTWWSGRAGPDLTLTWPGVQRR